MILCKWAACEFKAGDSARAEELLARAVALEGALSAAYALLIEAVRLKLPAAIKKRFETAFKEGLAATPNAQAATGLADATSLHHVAGIEYFGQKTHLKKILDYLKKAISQPFSEEQMERICYSLLLQGGYRLTRDYVARGSKLFPQNPLYPLLNAENEINRGRGMFDSWRVKGFLQRAHELADRMQPGPKRESILERVAKHQEMLDLLNPFGRLFDDFYDDPFGFDGEEDEW
jgi:hypothetical protein